MTRDGQPPADFREFFERTYPDMIARAILMCRHRQDAEDAVQDAYTQALTRWNRLRYYDSPDAWVYKITKQRVRSTWRRLARLRLVGVDVRRPPAASAEWTTQARAVLDALASLPPRQRQVIVLHCLDGRSQEEIARELGLTRGAVAASIHKGRQTMRRTLGMTGRAEEALVAGVPLSTKGGGAQPDDPLSAAFQAARKWLRAEAEADRQTRERIYAAVIADARGKGESQ